jgi:hypothetical protein
MTDKIVPHTANNRMEERNEKGLSLIVIGFVLWFFDALVFFFMPAGVRLGEQRPFALLIISAFLAGAIVMGFGLYLRKEKTLQ